MSLSSIDGTGAIVEEPNWMDLLAEDHEVQAAQQHWRRLTTELRERDLLSSVNAHAIQRLVFAYLLYDRCAREVAEHGPVTKPKRRNPKSIARLSPFYQAMREAGSDADRQEQELGLSPRRRSGAAKVVKKAERRQAGGGYLKNRAAGA